MIYLPDSFNINSYIKTIKTLYQNSKKFRFNLVESIFPGNCPICYADIIGQDGICGECWQKIRFIREPLCPSCGVPYQYNHYAEMAKIINNDFDIAAIKSSDEEQPNKQPICSKCIAKPPPYNAMRSAIYYDYYSRPIITELKFKDRIIYLNIIKQLLASSPTSDLLQNAQIVIPVPLSYRRIFSRRFNQSALIAKMVAKEYNIRYMPMILQRKKHTKPQTGLTRNQRLTNVRGAFYVPEKYQDILSSYQNILLLDDVCTTGATIDSACKELRKYTDSEINVVTIARRVFGYR